MQVDIVLISYNQEQYIAQAVESVLMQRVNDDVQVRVIVADDCSKDKTLEIIKSYEEKSPFSFVYLPIEDNMGHVRNYQRAFAACVGDYVAILEGDDYWTCPIHIQMQVDYLEMHNECVLTTTTPLIFNKLTGFATWHYNNIKEAVTVYTLRDLLQGNCVINMSAIIIRNSVLEKVDNKIYTVSLLDWLLYIVLCEYGVLVRFKTITSIYRSNVGIWENKLHSSEATVIREYDDILEHKYHQYFTEYIRRREPKKESFRGKIKRYISPLFVELYQLLMPPFIKQKIKKDV
jgi:glycosyltransferase involved in cell wall biosynthesis